MTSRGQEGTETGEGEETPRWLAALERAHTLTLRAARVVENAAQSGADLSPVAHPIEGALASLYSAFDAREDRLDATQGAETELDVAATILEGLEAIDPAFSDAIDWLEEAREELAVAEERFSRVPPEAAPPIEELRASKNVPRLHQVERDPLVPRLRIPAPLPPPPDEPPPLPKPKTREERDEVMAELRRRTEERRAAWKKKDEERAKRAKKKPADDLPDPPPGFARGRFSAVTEDAFLETRARELFEEIAMVGGTRMPLLGDPWRVADVLEKRLLASIDGLMSLGEVGVARVEPLVIDAPAKDPTRGFAAALILGCLDGRDSLGAIERVLHHLGPGDPEVRQHVGGGLKLAPHPGLPRMLRSLLAETDPACRALAIEVLAYRGWAKPEELLAAAKDPSPLVVAAALPALGILEPKMLDDVLEPARNAGDLSVREAAWAAMAFAGHTHAADVLAHELGGPREARAAVALAIVGDDRDADRLLARMRAEPSPSLVNAVGWAGLPESVEPLIELLTHDDPVVQLSAAYALDRITGARLYESVEVPPEAIMVPDVEEPDVGEPKAKPLANMVSDPRDRPSEGANDTVTQPTVSPDAWRAHWNERGPEYKPRLKYRRGNPYTPMVALWELDGLPLVPGERRWLQRELVARTGHYVRFDVHDFVTVQEASIKAWEPIAQRMSSHAGGWARPMRR